MSFLHQTTASSLDQESTGIYKKVENQPIQQIKMYNNSMKLKTLLAIIAISTIGFIGGGLSHFSTALEPQAGTADIPIEYEVGSIPAALSDGYYRFIGVGPDADRITITGTVQIELAPGANITLSDGINCTTGCNLTITGTGSLTITAPGNKTAGIGGNDTQAAGFINIKGGTISAQGGFNAAGIGGGGTGGTGGEITISGGAISAVGGGHAAGIGGGGGNGGIIKIEGGLIESTGGQFGAGIGCGREKNAGTIDISGGTIKLAQGGQGGAGIGTGYDGTGGTIHISGDAIIQSAVGGTNGAGIGGGYGDTGGTINIQGGIIQLARGTNAGAGIGGGSNRAAGSINISGGIIVSAAGALTGAGIGGGSGASSNGGTINISGGTIKSATGGTNGGAGIGKGYVGTGGTTQITGGSINASSIDPVPTSDGSSITVYKNTLTAVGFNESLVTAYYNLVYGINDVYTDESGTVYLYLPISGAALLALSFDPVDNSEEYYGTTYARTDNPSNNVKTLERLKLPTPLAHIDYENEKLIDLISDTNYDISVPIQTQSLSLLSLQPFALPHTDIAGETPIDDSWIGQTIDIIQKRIEIPIGDSDPQHLQIPPRPAVTPALKQLIKTAPKSEGENGTISGLTTDMEYSTDTDTPLGEWTTVESEDDLELAPGTYYFREISDGENFATVAATVVIPAYQAPVAPDSPDDLNLPATGLNLDLAYLIVLLLCVSFLRKQESAGI
jgi:hypothetical protein